jgi:hypothetical protein
VTAALLPTLFALATTPRLGSGEADSCIYPRGLLNLSLCDSWLLFVRVVSMCAVFFIARPIFHQVKGMQPLSPPSPPRAVARRRAGAHPSHASPAAAGGDGVHVPAEVYLCKVLRRHHLLGPVAPVQHPPLLPQERDEYQGGQGRATRLIVRRPSSHSLRCRQMWLALRAGRSWLRKYAEQRVADTVVSSTFRGVIILLLYLCVEVRPAATCPGGVATGSLTTGLRPPLLWLARSS